MPHCRVIFPLLAAMTVAGCVEPDTSRPWSTKGQSLSGPQESVVTDRESIRTLPVYEVSEDVAIVDPAFATPAAEPATADVDEVRIERETIVDRTIVPVHGAEGIKDDGKAGLRAVADAWLEEAAVHPLPLVRGYAFEALEHAPAVLERLAPAGFIDENRGVRFIATMAVGQAGLVGLVPLIEPGLLDRSDSVRAATIYTLRTLGQPTDPTPLALFATSDDPEIRANAIMILGLLGNPSAIPVIESSLGRGMLLANPMRVRITELQAAESLVMLGDQADVEPIRAALFAPVEQGEITVLACDILGRLGDEQARPMLMRLVMVDGNQRRPPEIRVAASGALLRLSPPHDPQLGAILLEAAAAKDARLRVQAAGALAHLPGAGSRAALSTLLADEDPLVRTAAAGAVLLQHADGSAVANTTVD